MLSYPGGGAGGRYPRVPPPPSLPGWGTGGVGTLVGGRYLGVPLPLTWMGGGAGTLVGGKYLGVPPPPILTWMGEQEGVGTLAGGRHLGVPPPLDLDGERSRYLGGAGG